MYIAVKFACMKQSTVTFYKKKYTYFNVIDMLGLLELFKNK